MVEPIFAFDQKRRMVNRVDIHTCVQLIWK